MIRGCVTVRWRNLSVRTSSGLRTTRGRQSAACGTYAFFGGPHPFSPQAHTLFAVGEKKKKNRRTYVADKTPGPSPAVVLQQAIFFRVYLGLGTYLFLAGSFQHVGWYFPTQSTRASLWGYTLPQRTVFWTRRRRSQVSLCHPPPAPVHDMVAFISI